MTIQIIVNFLDIFDFVFVSEEIITIKTLISKEK